MRGAHSNYGYKHLTLGRLLCDLNFEPDAAVPGDSVPEFDLPTSGGERCRARDLLGTRPILIVAASLTCPMAAAANRMLKRLHSRFGDEVEFITLYVREAHPGEIIEQASRLDQKLEYAWALKKRDDLPWTVIVDGVDGSVHSALSQRPNVAYLIDKDGNVVFRSLCAGDEGGLFRAVEAVARGARPPFTESRHRLGPLLDGIGNLRAMTRLGGPRAVRDVWRAVPPIAALAWISDLFHPLPPRWRVAAAAGVTGILAGATIHLLRTKDLSRR